MQGPPESSQVVELGWNTKEKGNEKKQSGVAETQRVDGGAKYVAQPSCGEDAVVSRGRSRDVKGGDC